MANCSDASPDIGGPRLPDPRDWECRGKTDSTLGACSCDSRGYEGREDRHDCREGRPASYTDVAFPGELVPSDQGLRATAFCLGLGLTLVAPFCEGASSDETTPAEAWWPGSFCLWSRGYSVWSSLGASSSAVSRIAAARTAVADTIGVRPVRCSYRSHTAV